MKDIWINLPVKDLGKSKAFYSSMGFRPNPGPGNSQSSASFLVGEKGLVLMLFDEPTFRSFVNGEIADPTSGAGVLFSVDAQSKEEVDAMARKAIEFGGKSSHQPGEMKGWMYGCLFTDPDGHRWNVLFMDMNKIPKQ